MRNKLLLILLVLSMVSPLYAHSGRLDGSGGHRVNKEYKYKGRYIEVDKEGETEYKVGTIKFKKGDYHYHIHPKHIEYKEGRYLPLKEKEVNDTQTGNIYIGEEVRVGSRFSDKYHTKDCRYIQRIKEENIIIFEDLEDAEKSGYIPCKNCKPDEVK